MNGVNAGLGTRTIQVDLDNLISDIKFNKVDFPEPEGPIIE